MKMGLCALLSLNLLLIGSSWASEDYQSPYRGQHTRQIKTLSADDIAQLRAGKGWGQAKAAELNGVPGPAHVLEMKTAIKLSAAQVRQVEAVFARMQSQAKDLGEKFIQAEQALNTGFADRSVTTDTLRKQLDHIGQLQAELRYVHLQAHLQTLPILSQHQVTQYNQLRGYQNSGDPCQQVPQGHDPVMWKQHNNCQ